MTYSQIIYELRQSIRVVVHYILIGEMIGFVNRDRFPMVSVLVCIVIHWIRSTMSQDIDYQVVMIHQTTIL